MSDDLADETGADDDRLRLPHVPSTDESATGRRETDTTQRTAMDEGGGCGGHCSCGRGESEPNGPDAVEADGGTALPRVPDVATPHEGTPLTEGFRPGTANDPPRPSSNGESTELAHVDVNGESVAVPAGEPLVHALDAVGASVPALCYYDRETESSKEVGPRSECRTCTVAVDGELVPACSYPVRDGLSIDTETREAETARSVNLDLVLSDHNLRCNTCSKNGRCELQDAAIEAGVDHPRYGVLDDRDAYEPLDDTSPFLQLDRNKCILCSRCVDACNDVQVEGVLRIEGQGQDTRIAFQNGAEAMADSTCVSCGHCSTVCPTGALTEKGMVGTSSMPIPGFTQKNSIGRTVERAASGEEHDDPPGVAGFMRRAKRQAREAMTDAGNRVAREIEHVSESVAAKAVPEGVLFKTSKAMGNYRLSKIDRTETTCGYCSVGCRFEVYTRDDDFLAVHPTAPDRATTHAPANDFSTCVKGKFGYEFVDDEGRLREPLVREGGELRAASWEEALSRIVDEFESIRSTSGSDALACFASSKCTNEEDYLMQKFARQVLETKNIDNCARLCHSSTVAALKQTVGFGAMSNSIEDVANADAYLISGSNTTESHPVLATRIKQNVRDGASLVVFEPRKIDIAKHADQFVRTTPGYDVAWINGLIRYLVEHDLHDEAFIEEHTRNFEAVVEKVEPFTPEEVERLAGVSPDDLARAAETIAAADSCVFGWAMGLTQHGHGTQNLLAMADLALVTGHVGKPNAGLSPFRGHNNVQGGGGDMGTLPNTLPGYQSVEDPDVLDRFERAWGVRPPDEVGLTVPEVFKEALDGNVRGLYVMGENPALSEPDLNESTAALEALEFLVVQDIFLTETAEYADVVLPAAAFPEKEGTFTNTERRVQLVQQAMEPPGEARQDWEILQELATRLGVDWSYDSPEEIAEEIAELTPIYGGITHDRLRDEGGLQWPCPDADHPGTRFLYEDGFNFPDGKARFVPADLGEPGELPDEEYPLTLTSGRVLYHFHTGTLTRRVEGIMDHVGESFVEIAPETASKLGVEDGDRVRVESKRGSIEVRAQFSDRPGPGVVFIPMHFARGAVNELTQSTFDATSGIPEYKVTSVRVTPVDDEYAPRGAGESADDAAADD